MIDAQPVPDFSRSIAAAWQIMEKLVEKGYCPALIYDDNGHWAVSFSGILSVKDNPCGFALIDNDGRGNRRNGGFLLPAKPFIIPEKTLTKL